MTEQGKLDLEGISRQDYETKSAKRDEEKKYYQDKLDEFGLKGIKRFLDYCPNPSENMKKDISFAHKDLGMIAEAIATKKPWAVVSGLNPSGPLHFGHKVIFDELLWMQKQGAEVFIPITNDESFVVGKSPSLAKARQVAYEQVIPSIIAFGFNPKKTHIFVDSDYTDIYNVAMDVSTNLTLNRTFKVFGFNDKTEDENPGTLFYRGAVQLAQILLPQYAEFGGPKPTIVPVGIDQHPYILLARDIAERKGLIPPAELIMKFLPSLNGPENKMSASIKGTSIFLTDSLKEAEDKIKKAFTGGSLSGSFQREHGGIPDICPIFLLQKYHFLNKEDSEKLYKECRGGRILCGECKSDALRYVQEYLKKHQIEFKKAKEKMDSFLLKTKLTSFLK